MAGCDEEEKKFGDDSDGEGNHFSLQTPLGATLAIAPHSGGSLDAANNALRHLGQG